MHLQDITNILNLQGIIVTKFIYGVENTIYITAKPIEYTQTCSCCKSSKVIRRGSSGIRKIKHLPILRYEVILKVPKIRMSCKDCGASFTWQYTFVTGQHCYTNEFKEFIAEKVPGATVMHCSKTLGIPYSTVEKTYKNYINCVVPELQKLVLLKSSYAMDAIKDVRKRISSDLAPTARMMLKRNKSVLEKRNEYLTLKEMEMLNTLLSLSSDLKEVYEWKEKLIEWYDCCSSVIQATNLFDKWCRQGHSLKIPEVEGRNGKIKSIQRRHYFTRNKDYYKRRILLECNNHFLTV